MPISVAAATEHEPDQVAEEGEKSADEEGEEGVQGPDDGGFAAEAVDHFEEDERGAGRVDVDAVADNGSGEFGVAVDFTK